MKRRFPAKPMFSLKQKSLLLLLLFGQSTKVRKRKLLHPEISEKINNCHQVRSVLTFEPKEIICSELMNVPCNI